MSYFRQQVRRMLRRRLRSGSQLKKNLSLGLFSLLFAGLGLWTSVFYHQHLMTMPSGVVFWGEDLSGLSRVQAEEKVQDLVWQHYQQELDVVVEREGKDNQHLRLTLSELGFEYDVVSSVERFLGLESLVLSADLLHGAADMTSAEPILDMQGDALGLLLDRVVSHEESAQNARLFLSEETGQWELEAHRDGYGLGTEEQLRLAEQLHQLALSGDVEMGLELQLETLSPEVRDVDLDELYEDVQRFLQKKVQWTVDGYEVVFALADYPWMIEVDEEAGEVSVSKSELRKYVADWASMFDREASAIRVGEPVVQENGHLRSAFDRVFEEGRTLDQGSLLQSLFDALSQEETETSVDLVYILVSPRVISWDGQELTQLSQGRSSYALAHSDDRLYNVRFGLAKYDGVVIPQGAEFSYNQILGWVTYEAGWKPALAIFGGGGVKPVPGGGLCQVSTTVFRAAVHEGLPITQRKPHSLDVSYYHAYGDGIDATIYPPADLDLKFVNDTPGPIVIHTYLDETAEEVFVEFYGVDDGREVVLEQVINRPVNLPSEVVYTDQLAPGEKEVISARQGRYVEWDWKIIREDGAVEERSIESLYPARRQTVRVGQ